MTREINRLSGEVDRLQKTSGVIGTEAEAEAASGGSSGGSNTDWPRPTGQGCWSLEIAREMALSNTSGQLGLLSMWQIDLLSEKNLQDLDHSLMAVCRRWRYAGRLTLDTAPENFTIEELRSLFGVIGLPDRTHLNQEIETKGCPRLMYNYVAYSFRQKGRWEWFNWGEIAETFVEVCRYRGIFQRTEVVTH